MSDYRVINDNGYERTWEELYEDNVRFQKYKDKLEQENIQLKEEIDYWLKLFSDNNHAFMSKDGKKITLFKVFDKLKKLQQENQELKKQLEEINKMIKKCGFVNIEQVMLNYCGLLTQQKEFIKYLEDEIKTLEKDILETIDDMDKYMKEVKSLIMEEILKEYKEIIGDKDDDNYKND